MSQLKWNLLAKGTAVMNESELSALILNMFIQVCHFYPSKDEDGAVIRPLPKIKQALSDPLHLPHVVQLLLTFDPTLGSTQRARKFKKVQAKKLVKSNIVKNFFRQIAFLAVLNFFPVQKLIFEIAKNRIWSK